MPLLQCPECGSGNLLDRQEEIECEGCGVSYPIIFGEVADFCPLPGLADPQGHAYTYSYSSRLYESWRKSSLMKLSAGISFNEEKRLLLDRLELEDGLKILDVGCGTGLFCREIAKLSPSSKVWGLDYSYSQLRRALAYKKKENLVNLHFVHGPAVKLPFADGSFNRALTTGAMHFFGDFQAFFKEVYRVLAPGGIFTAESYISYDYKPAESWIMRRIQKRVQKAGVHFFSREEAVGLASGAGFDEVGYFEKGIAFFLTARR
jgi:ubiquinone/menaquinone biosynthesis C-methylase UbiE